MTEGKENEEKHQEIQRCYETLLHHLQNFFLVQVHDIAEALEQIVDQKQRPQVEGFSVALTYLVQDHDIAEALEQIVDQKQRPQVEGLSKQHTQALYYILG